MVEKKREGRCFNIQAELQARLWGSLHGEEIGLQGFEAEDY